MFWTLATRDGAYSGWHWVSFRLILGIASGCELFVGSIEFGQRLRQSESFTFGVGLYLALAVTGLLGLLLAEMPRLFARAIRLALALSNLSLALLFATCWGWLSQRSTPAEAFDPKFLDLVASLDFGLTVLPPAVGAVVIYRMKIRQASRVHERFE